MAYSTRKDIINIQSHVFDQPGKKLNIIKMLKKKQ